MVSAGKWLKMVRKQFRIRTTVRPARYDSLIPRWVWLAVAVIVLGALGAGRAFAASSCDICGGALTNTFYSVTDKFRDQKRMICGECVKLPRVCFVCGVPVKTNYTALEDGR